LFVKGLVRFGWIPLVAVLLIAWLLEWASWRKILALGIAGALAILLSPVVFGVTVAIDSRRRNMRKESSKAR
jgi:O-antigen ligase